MAEANKRYKRRIRVEDWNGNIYEFGASSSSGGSAGGATIGADDIDGVDHYTDGDPNTPDNRTNINKAIKLSGSTINKILIGTTVEDLRCGKYSVIFRMKVSDKSASNRLILINTYHNDGEKSTLLSTTYLSPSNFKEANKYQTFGFVTDLNGIYNDKTDNTNLRIIITVIGSNIPLDYWLDYVAVSMAFTGIGASLTTLS